MFHITCKIPGAPATISGLAFEPHEDGGVRTVEPVEPAVAERFATIPGYETLDLDAPPPPPTPAEVRAAIVAKLKAAEVEFDGRAATDKLAEILAAHEAKIAAAAAAAGAA